MKNPKKTTNDNLPEPDEDFDSDVEFECCNECDLPDACSDYGCAIKAGLRSKNLLW